MWETISGPWQVCFEEAWQSFCNGSIPIGAVLVDNNEEIISRGRNRISEHFAPKNQTCSNRLAHAEINVLLQLGSTNSDELKDYVLYTTTEPCVLCFGAIVMSGVRKVRYAATDPIAGGANLKDSDNTFIKSRNIEIQTAPKLLGNIQRVLRTEHVIRTLGYGRAERFLQNYNIDYPLAVELGRNWFENGKLIKAVSDHASIKDIFNEISRELNKYQT